MVVFPAPLCPRNEVIWPSKKVMLRQSTAARGLPGYTFTRSSTHTPIGNPTGSASKKVTGEGGADRETQRWGEFSAKDLEKHGGWGWRVRPGKNCLEVCGQ